MWYEEISPEISRILCKLSGSLNLPEIDKYESEEHFLTDVYSRIIESSSLIRQAQIVLGNT